MEWITPKTDWAASTDESGKYTGDYFNIKDYNRIKNNIEFLGAVAHQFWPVFVRAMPDRNYQEYPYADEINVLSENLEAINKYVGCDIGEKTEYADNGAFIGFADLNRIESACLKMYEEMRFLYTRPHAIPFRLGGRYFPLKDPRIPEPVKPSKLRLPFAFGSRFGGAYHPFKSPAPYHKPPVITPKRRLPYRLGGQYFPFEDPEILKEEKEERRLPYRMGREYFPFKLPRTENNE